jgi:hypothetical protein
MASYAQPQLEVSRELTARVKNLFQNWSVYAAIGSFSLYFLGYLSLRFHLMVFGVTTDLQVWDERYLFHGANFLIYLGSLIPSAILLFAVAFVLTCLPYYLAPAALRQRASLAFARWRARCESSNRLTLAGLVLSVLTIQLVMRQCFGLDNLLLAPQLPSPGWLAALLLDSNLLVFYFIGILAATAVSGALLWAACKRPDPASALLRGLFICTFGVQTLLLPVNYGILVADQQLERVSSIPAQAALNTCQTAWIVWQGKDWTTFLLRDWQAGVEKRSLVAVRYSDIKALDIVSQDSSVRTLFQDRKPCPASGKD